MSESIDNLFKRSRFQKKLPIRNSVWRRVEAKLEAQRLARRRRHIFYMAACLTFLIVVIGSMSLSSTNYTYTLEDQLLSSHTYDFTKEEISYVNTLYSDLQLHHG